MKLNVKKTKVLHVHSKRNLKHDYNINGDPIANVTEQRDLGVIVDENLTFDQHRKKVIRTCNRAIGIIRRNFRYSNTQVQKKLYNAYVYPHLTFCSQLWRSTSVGSILVFEQLLRSFTRGLFRNPDVTYLARLDSLELRSIYENHVIIDLITLYKATNFYQFSSFFKKHLTFTLSANVRRSRRKNNTMSILPNIECGNFWLSNTIPLWNKLSPKTVNAKNVRIFKFNLLSHDSDILKTHCQNILSRFE